MAHAARILFVNHTLDPMAGGAERVLHSLIEGLGSEGFDLHLAVPVSLNREELRPDATYHRLPPFHMVPSRSPWNVLKTVYCLLKMNAALVFLIRRVRPDVIYVNSIFALHFCALPAIVSGIPFIYHEHNLVSQRSNSIWHLAFPWLAGLARTIIAISEAVAGELRQVRVPESRIRVVHNAIDKGAEPPRPERVRRAGQTFRIAQIANLHRWKGHTTVVHAIAIASRAGFDVSVSFFGRVQDEELAEQLEELAKNLGVAERVDFLGFVSDPISRLVDFDSLVLASEAEPFGLAILEGMSAGIPVVATASGGALEIIDDEESGLLFAPNDPNELAECWRRLIEDPLLGKRLSAKALVAIDARFSAESQIKGVAEAIRDTLE